MEICMAKKLLSKYNGNYSLLYPIIKEEVSHMGFRDYDLSYPYEFICFENDYLNYYIDMKERKTECKKVVDIGCQYGFQSFIFKEFEYIGIDCGVPQELFFRNKGNYTNDIFPKTNVNISDAVVISNMSLGYFNNGPNGVTDRTIVNKLKEAKYLYIATTKSILNMLLKDFKLIRSFTDESYEFPRVYLVRNDNELLSREV